MGTDIPRFDRDASADEIAAALLAHGVVIVERLVDDALCDRVAAELSPWIDTTPRGADDFSGRNTRRTGALLTRVPASIKLIAHPLVLEVCEQVLWPQKTTFQLHLTQAICIGPAKATLKFEDGRAFQNVCEINRWPYRGNMGNTGTVVD